MENDLKIIAAAKQHRKYPRTQKNVGRGAVVNTPQFMGLQNNPSGDIEAVRDFIKQQKRIKGFTFDLEAGNNPELNVDISGTARLLLGIVFFNNQSVVDTPADLPKQVTMTVNNEIIIEKVHLQLLGSEHIDDEYYFIPRPLDGQDDIKFSFNNVGKNQQVFMALYYI